MNARPSARTTPGQSDPSQPKTWWSWFCNVVRERPLDGLLRRLGPLRHAFHAAEPAGELRVDVDVAHAQAHFLCGRRFTRPGAIAGLNADHPGLTIKA